MLNIQTCDVGKGEKYAAHFLDSLWASTPLTQASELGADAK